MSPTVPPISEMTTSGVEHRRDTADAVADLVRDVRDDLDGQAEVLPARSLRITEYQIAPDWLAFRERFSSMKRS